MARGFSDSDWAESREDQKSTSGYLFKLGIGSISWRSRKQRTVALSSTEAEYVALSDSCREALWFRSLLKELKIMDEKAITIYCNNEGAKALSSNRSHHSRTKHISVRHHFVRECTKKKKISVKAIRTHEMAADSLTKGLGKVLLVAHRTLMGVL